MTYLRNILIAFLIVFLQFGGSYVYASPVQQNVNKEKVKQFTGTFFTYISMDDDTDVTERVKCANKVFHMLDSADTAEKNQYVSAVLQMADDVKEEKRERLYRSVNENIRNFINEDTDISLLEDMLINGNFRKSFVVDSYPSIFIDPSGYSQERAFDVAFSLIDKFENHTAEKALSLFGDYIKAIESSRKLAKIRQGILNYEQTVIDSLPKRLKGRVDDFSFQLKNQWRGRHAILLKEKKRKQALLQAEKIEEEKERQAKAAKEKALSEDQRVESEGPGIFTIVIGIILLFFILFFLWAFDFFEEAYESIEVTYEVIAKEISNFLASVFRKKEAASDAEAMDKSELNIDDPKLQKMAVRMSAIAICNDLSMNLNAVPTDDARASATILEETAKVLDMVHSDDLSLVQRASGFIHSPKIKEKGKSLLKNSFAEQFDRAKQNPQFAQNYNIIDVWNTVINLVDDY